MKVILASVGSRGDVQPFAILGQGLMAAGHDVTVLGPPEARGLAEGRGVHYVDCGRDIMAWLQEFDVATIGIRAIFNAFRDVIDNDLHSTMPILLEAARGAHVVAGAGLQVLAPTIGHAVGAASTYVYYAPSLLPSDEHPPPVVDPQGLPRLANRAFHRVTLGFFNRIVLPAINRERRALNLVPHANMVEALPMDLMLAYDAALATPPTDLADSWRRHRVEPRTVTQVGALAPSGGAIDDDLARFVSGRVVYIGFGSMPDQGPEETLRLIDDAAARADVRVVMLGTQPGTERVRVVKQAAHAALFPRVQVVVHHGGAGTTATASRAGVPQVVVPHFVDQPLWAYRVKLRGVSAGTIRRRDLTAENLASALRRAMDDADLRARARQLAADLQATDPMAAAVSHLEKLAATAPSVRAS